MKKKGFTLIELLAVIVILAIIALITLPLITGVVEKARKGSAVSSAYGYVDAVEKYMMMHYLNSEKYPITLEKGQTYQISKKEFKTNLGLNLIENVYAEGTLYLNDFITVKGVKPSSGTVTIGNNNTVEKANIVTNSYLVECNGKKCVAKRKMVVDKTAPIISEVTASAERKSATINYTANDPESGIDHVKCYYKRSSESNYTNSVDGNNGVCEITGLYQSTDYDFKVEVTNGDGVSSNESNTFKTKDGPCRITSQAGSELAVGDEVTCGTEAFYYIGEGTGNEEGKVKLLAKYAIDSNYNQVVNSGVKISFSSSAYWTNRNLNYNDTINPYLYDENSNIYPYISAYVDKIMNLGVTSVSGRLISYEECYPLPNEIKYCTVYGSDCWLGSHARNHSADAVYTISYGGSYSGYSYRSSLYVRPLILIPKDEL